jgi:hypothetical protein
MSNESELLESHEQWAENLDHALPEHLNLSTATPLPPGLGELKIRLGIQRWPTGQEHHFSARLADPLLEVMRHGAKELGEPLLPPHAPEPLDLLRARKRHGHEWSDPITDLDMPLWVALVDGNSRRFAIEYRLIIRINTKWDIAPAEQMTPKQLLSSFGFDPNDYSLYREHSPDVLPPDTPIHLKRGEHFEAQKDGRYGLRPVVRGLQTIEDDITAVAAGGVAARLITEKNQRFVEVSGLEIPSPPWSGSAATIAIAVPANVSPGWPRRLVR